MKFSEYRTGLYYYVVPRRSDKTEECVSDYCFVTTVANNKSIFTRREIEGADRACNLYIKLGRPGQRRFEQIVGSG